MDTTRTVKKLTEWEPCSSRPVGRPRLRWLDQVEEDLKKVKVRKWREKCKDRRLWNKIVKQAKTMFIKTSRKLINIEYVHDIFFCT